MIIRISHAFIFFSRISCIADVAFHETIRQISWFLQSFEGINISILEGSHRMDVGSRLFHGYAFDFDNRACPLKPMKFNNRVLPENSTFFEDRGVIVYVGKKGVTDIPDTQLKAISKQIQKDANRVIATSSVSGIRNLMTFVRTDVFGTLDTSTTLKKVCGEDIDFQFVNRLKNATSRFAFNEEPFCQSVSIVNGMSEDAAKKKLATTLENVWKYKDGRTWTSQQHVRFIFDTNCIVEKYDKEITKKYIFTLDQRIDWTHFDLKYIIDSSMKLSAPVKQLAEMGADSLMLCLVSDLVTLFTFFPHTMNKWETFISSIKSESTSDMADSYWLLMHVIWPCHLLANIISFHGYKAIYAKIADTPEVVKLMEEYEKEKPNAKYKQKSAHWLVKKATVGRAKSTRTRYYNMAFAAFVEHYLDFLSKCNNSTSKHTHKVLPGIAEGMIKAMKESVEPKIKTPIGKTPKPKTPKSSKKRKLDGESTCTYF
jgi:hypothetical protein